MRNNIRIEFATRDRILKMLTDDELGRVSTGETPGDLAEGDEYVDLESLRDGVMCAAGLSAPMGHVLARKSVLASTWSRILSELAANGAGPSHPHA